MSDLVKIDAELTRLSVALGKAVTDYDNVSREAAESRSEYDLAMAKALLTFRFEKDATEAIKKALATELCAAQMTDARIKEAMRDALKERIRALEQVLSVQQSRLRHMEDATKTF